MKILSFVLFAIFMCVSTAHAQKWVRLAEFPEPTEELVGASTGDRIYVIGGRVGAAGITAASNTNVVEEYDPGTDSWGGVHARMRTARSAMASGVYGGRIYVMGGEFQDSQMMATFRALEVYDPANNTWSVLPSMPVARHGLVGAVVGYRLHMVSGDVQWAETGVHVHAPYHDAFELGK
jgi:N-acetylneuraminic acid mutarotase